MSRPLPTGSSVLPDMHSTNLIHYRATTLEPTHCGAPEGTLTWSTDRRMSTCIPCNVERHPYQGAGGACTATGCGRPLTAPLHRQRVGGGAPLYQQAEAFSRGLPSIRQRAYAAAIIAYHRNLYTQGDGRAWPFHWETVLAPELRTCIATTIRHYLDGDVPMPQGVR